MTAPAGPEQDRPAWWKPGMSAAEIRMWEAAERAVADAPEIRRGDDVYLALRPLVGGMLARPRAQQQGRDAA